MRELGTIICLMTAAAAAAASLARNQPPQKVMVTLRQYDACSTAALVLSNSTAQCARMVKCYGRRVLLDLEQCELLPATQEHVSGRRSMRRMTGLNRRDADDMQGTIMGPGTPSSAGNSTELERMELHKQRETQTMDGWVRERFPAGKVALVERDPVAGIGPRDSSSSMAHVPLQTASSASGLGEQFAWITSYQWNMDMVRARELWQTHPLKGADALLAVLDTGMGADVLGAFVGDDGVSSRIIPGYDFISDNSTSRDGDGRDGNYIDPGDSDPVECPGGPSWHGTQVASVAAADFKGFMGVAPRAGVMPLRVLGKCGTGSVSDIADAIVYAAGGVIDGVPANAQLENDRRRRIIVLSLGGEGLCPSYMQSAIDLAVSRNVTVYAAAGNSNWLWAAEQFPANCKGVVNVGALTKPKAVAPYSSQYADVYMPGGYLDGQVPCLINDESAVRWCIGTSIATPHAAALTALTGCVPHVHGKPELNREKQKGTYVHMRKKYELQSIGCEKTKSGDVWKGFGQIHVHSGYQRRLRVKGLFTSGVAHHTCAVDVFNQTKCWGFGGSGTLGTGNTENRGGALNVAGRNLEYIDVEAAGEGSATRLSMGEAHTCAILQSGKALCWGGIDYDGELLGYENYYRGFWTPPEFAINLGLHRLNQVTSSATASRLSCGMTHTCAVLDGDPLESSSGMAKCWGYNIMGVLGQGDGHSLRAPFEVPPIRLGSNVTVREIASGKDFACALLHDSGVKCWGDNQRGQLGIGTAIQHVGNDPQQMGGALSYAPLGSNVSAGQVAAGYHHVCIITKAERRVKCWGSNDYGQLGYGDGKGRGRFPEDMGDNLTYVPLGEGRTALVVSAGGFHTCVLLDDFSVKCWGLNIYGALGHSKEELMLSSPQQEPVNFGALDPGVHAKSISCGAAFSCALLSDGDVRCWGDNYHGQLAQGHQYDLYTPVWGLSALLGYNFIPACEAGTFVVLAADGSVEQCVPCPMGTYSSDLHSPECTACPVGKYSNVTGAGDASACLDCGIGTFSIGSACVACPPGTYSNETTGVSDRCHPCVEGTFAGGSGAVECELCARGTSTAEAAEPGAAEDVF